MICNIGESKKTVFRNNQTKVECVKSTTISQFPKCQVFRAIPGGLDCKTCLAGYSAQPVLSKSKVSQKCVKQSDVDLRANCKTFTVFSSWHACVACITNFSLVRLVSPKNVHVCIPKSMIKSLKCKAYILKGGNFGCAN